MTLYYHGTSLVKATKIAAFNSLLSPYDQCLQDIKSTPKLQLRANQEELTLEDLAFIRIKDHYSPNEFLHRVFHVSLTTDLNIATQFAFQHPSRHEIKPYGGLVFGFDLTPTDEWIIGGNGILYSPSLTLTKENLKEIHTTPLASIHLPYLRNSFVFNRYSPTYHTLTSKI